MTVVGIGARNGITMISHDRHFETVEGLPFGRELVIRGAKERLARILFVVPSLYLRFCRPANRRTDAADF